MHPHQPFRQPLTRRDALRRIGSGFGMLAFASLVNESIARAAVSSDGALGPRPFDHPPKATAGIFLPSFVFVALSSPFVPRLRRSPWAGAFLDGANAASVALMAAVTWELGRAAVVDWLTAALALGAAVILLASRLNSAWLVAGGAAVGGLAALVH